MGRTIGIDLGTYNSAAAVVSASGRVVMIESQQGRTLHGKSFPSFVLFDRLGRPQRIGQRAKEELALNPELVVWGTKRLVGLSYSTAVRTGELQRFAFAVEEGPGGGVLVRVGDERFTPEHVLELILREIREAAQNTDLNPDCGGQVDKAVISIPAYYKAVRTAPILEAARRAGFTEVETISEPTAAAMVQSLDLKEEANVLAFDIGAGTLDVTVVMLARVGGELVPGELCSAGHEALGGIDMDDLLFAQLVQRHDLHAALSDPRQKALLMSEVERAKVRLSTCDSTVLDLPTCAAVTFGRAQLEEILAPLLARCRGPIRIAMEQSGLSYADIDHVLFIGGPTHMPCVRKVVLAEMRQGGARTQVLTALHEATSATPGFDPMECVAKGAALRAARVIEPVARVIGEGYGTVLSDSETGQLRYAPIIREGASFPVAGSTLVCHPDNQELEVPIPLVSKRPDPDKSQIGHTVYRYEHIGSYALGITPTGSNPLIEVKLQVTADKRLIATLKQSITAQSVRFEGLDLLVGEEIELSSQGGGRPRRPLGILDALAKPKQAARHWTADQLQRHQRSARAAIELAASSGHPHVQRSVKALLEALERVGGVPQDGPDLHCPVLSNRIKEVLDVLRQPHIAVLTHEVHAKLIAEVTDIAAAL